MKIVFATHNANKLKEVQKLIPNNFQLLSLDDINCHEDIPETQLTIKGNALQKAEFIKQHYQVNCFADDTGLEVEALNGDPGVFSARYAGPQRDSEDNIQKLLKNLEGQTNRNAQFKTVIALYLNGEMHTFTGICQGTITQEKQGEGGFGYDPVFQANGYEQTFAEISLEEKNRIGHRGKAIQQLVSFLNSLEVK